MLPQEIDEDYYGPDGDKICDSTGNSMIYVNDGLNLYDIEKNEKLEIKEINETIENEKKISDNYCITLSVKILYSLLQLLQYICVSIYKLSIRKCKNKR